MRIFKHLKTDWFRYGFETLAVVVGILAAFALDNWNEERKSRIQEINLLYELVENLESDCMNFESNINSQNDLINRIDEMIAHLEAKRPYIDTLQSIFMAITWFEEFFITTTAYETIKSIGIERVSSKELKKALAAYYEVSYPRYYDIIDGVNHITYSSMFDFFNRNFRQHGLFYVPTNYAALVSDPYYLNYAYGRKNYKMEYIEFNNIMKAEAVVLIDIIQEEIESRTR